MVAFSNLLMLIALPVVDEETPSSALLCHVFSLIEAAP
jgi:hypothetical protein